MNNSLRFLKIMGRYTGMMLAAAMLLAAMCIPSSKILKQPAASSELAPGDAHSKAIHCMQDTASDIETDDSSMSYTLKSSDGGPSFGPMPPSVLNRMTNEFRRKSKIMTTHETNCPNEICITPVRVYHRSD